MKEQEQVLPLRVVIVNSVGLEAERCEGLADAVAEARELAEARDRRAVANRTPPGFLSGSSA